jgi:uncharacterized membrane protein
MYSTSLLIVHIISAIVGIGATFTFGVLGALSGRIEGPGALALLEGNLAIEKFLVRPFALFLLPLSGALMIFKRGWSTDFFSHTWLLIAIVLYIIAAGVATGILTPGVKKLIDLGKNGHAGTPEFNRIVSMQQRLGPALDVIAIAIVVLMVWKPGG